MEYQEHLKSMRSFQTSLIGFIDSDSSSEEDYQNLMRLLEELRGQPDHYDIKEIVHLLFCIVNNHYRNSHFFEKMERILNLFFDQIKKSLSPREIFNAFKSNKRILLFLFEQKIITPDKYIVNVLSREKYNKQFYLQYFFPELKIFFDDQNRRKIIESIRKYTENQTERFINNRKIGENEDHICYLIRNDMIDQFISYVNQKNISLSSIIKTSIYETNSLLLKNNNNITLIEYAAFFGAIQVFRYLYLNKAPLLNTIWIYAIHSQNPELITCLLEDFKIKPINNSYKDCLLESIKCHHVEVSNYLIENFFNYQIEYDAFLSSLKYCNYIYFPNELSQISALFHELCKNDYPSIVKLLLQETNIDINAIIVLINIFLFIKFLKKNIFYL